MDAGEHRTLHNLIALIQDYVETLKVKENKKKAEKAVADMLANAKNLFLPN